MSLRSRRMTLAGLIVICFMTFIALNPEVWRLPVAPTAPGSGQDDTPRELSALAALEQLAVKGRAPKTGYARSQFGQGWMYANGCDTRNIILARDLTGIEINERCQVTRGQLRDPYTGNLVFFIRGPESSQEVQIDHVVALSNAWQTGAGQLTQEQRIQLANDPLNLLAVAGEENQKKSDGDAATWLPPYKPFRCQYVTRQIAVKQKYSLWVTSAEEEAMERVLQTCPSHQLPL